MHTVIMITYTHHRSLRCVFIKINCMECTYIIHIIIIYLFQDNIVFMDQVLKTIGQQKAQEERSKLLHELPSASFIRNYLR